MENLKQLQKRAEQMEAIAWLFSLVTAIVNGIGTLVMGVFAMVTGCFGVVAILVASAPLIFFCLLFVVIAAAIR